MRSNDNQPLTNTVLIDLAHQAATGDSEALGQLMEIVRPYLLQIANNELDPRLRQKAGGSDLVQQTLLEAAESINEFGGNSPDSFLAWLRRILLNNIANHRRYFQTEKRDIDREVQSIGVGSGKVSMEFSLSDQLSKSDQLLKQEEIDVLAAALQRLSADHQQVIHWRNQQKLTFPEIGKLMSRSEDAARKLWARAIETLKAEMDQSGLESAND